MVKIFIFLILELSSQVSIHVILWLLSSLSLHLCANSLVTLLGDWTISINFHPDSSTTPSVTENRGDRDQSAHLLTSFSQSEHE